MPLVFKAQKPYGHTAYTRRSKSGKLVQVQAKGVKPQEGDAPQKYLFHTTGYHNMGHIKHHGLVPRRGESGTYQHSVYGAHSQGKVFLAGHWEAASAWAEKIQELLESNSDKYEEQVPVMLRVKHRASKKDPVGNQDIEGSRYVTETIPPHDLEFYHPEHGWRPLEYWGDDTGIEHATASKDEHGSYAHPAGEGGYTPTSETHAYAHSPTTAEYHTQRAKKAKQAEREQQQKAESKQQQARYQEATYAKLVARERANWTGDKRAQKVQELLNTPSPTPIPGVKGNKLSTAVKVDGQWLKWTDVLQVDAMGKDTKKSLVFDLAKAKKPYGHVSYTRRSKSGKLSRVGAKGVKPHEQKFVDIAVHPKIGTDKTFRFYLKPVRGGIKLSLDPKRGSWGPIMPPASVRHFVNDLKGKVELPPSNNPYVNAVIQGKAEVLGKGDDGIAFRVGDHVVKMSTTVPYVPENPGHRTPEQAKQMLRRQVEVANSLADKGIEGIQRSVFVEHGDKGFQVKPYVEIPKKLTRDQLEQAQSAVLAMHKEGYSLNDSVQVGIYKGRPVLFDVGKAAPIPKNDDKTGIYSVVTADLDSLRILYRDHGEVFVRQGQSEGQQAIERVQNKFDKWVTVNPKLARRHLVSALEKRATELRATLRGEALASALEDLDLQTWGERTELEELFGLPVPEMAGSTALDEDKLRNDAHGALKSEVVPLAKRAISAGADPATLRYLGAGMQSIVFADKDRAYKVGRSGEANKPTRINEARALEALQTTGAAKYIPKFYSYDKANDVIVMEHIIGKPGGWSAGKQVRPIYDKIVEAAKQVEFSAPEYKEDSFLLREGRDPVMIDLGFMHPRGSREAQHVRDTLAAARSQKDVDLLDVGFSIRNLVAEGHLQVKEAKEMGARIQELYGPDHLEARQFQNELDYTLEQATKKSLILGFIKARKPGSPMMQDIRTTLGLPYGHVAYTRRSKSGKLVQVKAKGAKHIDETKLQIVPQKFDPKKLAQELKRREAGKGEHRDLTRQELDYVLKNTRFALVSAGRNPANEKDASLTDAQIDARYGELQKSLVNEGFVFTHVEGSYGGGEKSFLVMVHDAERDHIRELGAKYNQDSVIYADHGSNEMFYTTDDAAKKHEYHKGSGHKVLPAKTSDYYTLVHHPDGTTTKFVLDFDFDHRHVWKALLRLCLKKGHHAVIDGRIRLEGSPTPNHAVNGPIFALGVLAHASKTGHVAANAYPKGGNPPAKSALSSRALSKSLETLAITAMTTHGQVEKINEGRFGARKITFSNGVKACLKPKNHSTELYRGVHRDAQHLNEVAAYQLDRQLLHFEVIPPAILTVYKGQQASVAQWVSGKLAKDLVPHVFNRARPDWKQRVSYLAAKLDTSKLRKLILFDLIVNNTDRHAKNCIFVPYSSQVWGIDNGLAFGHHFQYYYNVFHRFLYQYDLQLTSEERRKLGLITRDRLTKTLGRYLAPRQIEETYLRIQWLLHAPSLGFKLVSQGNTGRDSFPSYAEWFRQAMRGEPQNRIIAQVSGMGAMVSA